MNTTVNRSILLCQAANVSSLCRCYPCLTGGCTFTTTPKLKEEKPTSNSRECANAPFPSCCSSYHGLFICYLPGAGANEKEHATTLHSWHGVSMDRFRTTFLGMRLRGSAMTDHKKLIWRHCVTGQEQPFFYKRKGTLKILGFVTSRRPCWCTKQ